MLQYTSKINELKETISDLEIQAELQHKSKQKFINFVKENILK